MAAQVAAGERGERRVAVDRRAGVRAPVAAVEAEDEPAARRGHGEQVRHALPVGPHAGGLEGGRHARAVERAVLERAQQHAVGLGVDAELLAPAQRGALGEVVREAEEAAEVAGGDEVEGAAEQPRDDEVARGGGPGLGRGRDLAGAPGAERERPGPRVLRLDREQVADHRHGGPRPAAVEQLRRRPPPREAHHATRRRQPTSSASSSRMSALRSAQAPDSRSAASRATSASSSASSISANTEMFARTTGSR